MGIKACAIIPAFNDESSIGRVVYKTAQHVDRVLVVDDGSIDNTASQAADSGAYVIKIPTNRGKGYALKVGFRYAIIRGFDIVITLDADLQHDPSEIPKFIQHYLSYGSEIVVGNRMSNCQRIPRIRCCPNKIGNYTFSWLIGQPIEDSQCGFRLYHRAVLENIETFKDGFDAEADMLLKAGKIGYTIVFIPIKAIYFRNSQRPSHYRSVRDTFRISIVFLRNLFCRQ